MMEEQFFAWNRCSRSYLPDLHEAIVALHRKRPPALQAAGRCAVASRFLKLGMDGEQERDRLQLRKRQLAFHCQREGPSSTYRPDKAAFDGDPCVPYLINDASFQMYLSRRPPSYVFDGRTFVDKSGTPVKEHKKEWRDVFHLRALQYNVSYGTLPGDLAKLQQERRSTRGAARAAPTRAPGGARPRRQAPTPRDTGPPGTHRPPPRRRRECDITGVTVMPGPLLRHLEPIVGSPRPVSPNSSVLSCASRPVTANARSAARSH